jgi:hypothetical protein
VRVYRVEVAYEVEAAWESGPEHFTDAPSEKDRPGSHGVRGTAAGRRLRCGRRSTTVGPRGKPASVCCRCGDARVRRHAREASSSRLRDAPALCPLSQANHGGRGRAGALTKTEEHQKPQCSSVGLTASHLEQAGDLFFFSDASLPASVPTPHRAGVYLAVPLLDTRGAVQGRRPSAQQRLKRLFFIISFTWHMS